MIKREEFLDFILDADALRFGEFTLKSGRKSPFFINTGLFTNGSQLDKLAEFYAKAIYEKWGLDFDVLFGPSYKGIPLCVATSMAIYRLYGKEVRYCSNRKEIKDHGDTGILLGSKLKKGDRVLIIEDVTTSGASIEETVPIIRMQGDVEIIGLIVSIDRNERGKTPMTALKEIEKKYGFKAEAIISMLEIIDIMEKNGRLSPSLKKELDDYYDKYAGLRS